MARGLRKWVVSLPLRPQAPLELSQKEGGQTRAMARLPTPINDSKSSLFRSLRAQPGSHLDRGGGCNGLQAVPRGPAYISACFNRDQRTYLPFIIKAVVLLLHSIGIYVRSGLIQFVSKLKDCQFGPSPPPDLDLTVGWCRIGHGIIYNGLPNLDPKFLPSRSRRSQFMIGPR